MQPLELPLPEHLAGAEAEVQLGTNKSEAFADDTNVTCKQDRNCVLALKNILINFSRISGLQCNLEKTCIMFIGPRNEAEIAAISQLGFTIVNSLKVLGCLVKSDGINEETNFDTVIGKINQSAALWSRFNLSIKGRIAISKIMFVSHITYLGAILTPTPGQIKRMEDIIVNFVLRGTPFARDRLYAHPEKGGLGLVQIEHMLTSLKCSWLERILRDGVNDTWRGDLIVIGGHCFQNLREDSVHEFTNPLLQNIVQSYWIMALAWWKLNNNFMMAPLLRNPIFTRGRNPAGGFDNRAIDSTVVGQQQYMELEEKWLRCKYNDFVENGIIVPLATAQQRTGIQFTVNAYFNIVRAVNHAKVRYGKARTNNGTCLHISRILLRGTKGSKKYRRALSGDQKVTGLNISATYFTLIGVTQPDAAEGAALLGLWAKSYWPKEISTFLFQLYNNSLAVGARLSNRYQRDPDRIVDERCVFCRNEGYNIPMRETFMHLFYDCFMVKN